MISIKYRSIEDLMRIDRTVGPIEQAFEEKLKKFYKSEKLKAEKLSNKEIMRLASRYATESHTQS